MRTGLLVVAWIVTLLAGVMTGAPLAGDAGSAALANLYKADPERAAGESWQARDAIETGALPGDSVGALRMGRLAPEDAGLAVVEIGGVKYRPGLDTGP